MSKYKTELCNNDMTFQDCELAILRHAVDETEKIQQQKIVNTDEVKKIIKIVEEFLQKKPCICYGGTAINNILPTYAQFYDKDIEIPDYDFYSKTPLEDAKELADIYYKAGYEDIEAKAGVHHGTFKVFVNFIPVADITLLVPEIFDTMAKEAIKINGISYSPANFLRMNMYLELSRPEGDVSRWEKILKRLTLLNKFYPLKPLVNCETVDFQRKMVDFKTEAEHIYFIVRDSFINQGVVFFGGYASSLYLRYMPEKHRRILRKIPDFDVISEEPDKCALIIKEQLNQQGYKNARTIKHPAIGELVPEHVEIRIGHETLAFVFRPIACHSYNKITIGPKEICVATIDTMLSFYFAFYYTKQPYFYQDRLLCMCQFMFEVEQKNRLEQRGLLKRFSINCYGKQPTIETIRAEKAKKFGELKNKRNTREYEEWFLKYSPSEGATPTVKKLVKKRPKTRTQQKRRRRQNNRITKRIEFLID